VVTTDAPRRRLTRLVPLRRRREPDGRMTVVEHLSELRRRLVICIIAVVIGGSIMFVLSTDVISFLVTFYKDATGRPKGTLIFTGPLDAFATRLKIATYGGIVLAAPVWLYQMWRFITPGLNPKEKRYAIPFVITSMLLFALGGVVALFTLEPALDFLLNIGGSDLKALLTADRYISLVALMIVAFGLSFEFPVVLMFLLLARVITTQQLRQWRRWAIVAIIVFAAVITPSQDPYSLFAMAIPMYLFYEAVIIIGRLLKR
jgi:sec-independent protein translocase protein TatC